MGNQTTIERAPYRPWGRYVCDWSVTSIYLFDTLAEAVRFAKQWDCDCNVGWLAPVYDRRTGKNRAPTPWEARRQISNSAELVDYRKRTPRRTE